MNEPGCKICKHLITEKAFTCKAYPGGIPWPILSGDVTHTEPLPGDNGIRFEPIDEEEASA